ncbi:MAG TPA: PfkB family carbohydrate kinase, partial [Anaerolineaceae bacterium]
MQSGSLAVCLGDSVIDTYQPPLDHGFIGGNAVNTAVAIRRAGFPSAFAGFTGDDPAGQAILQALDRQGVDTSQVRTRPGPTRRAYLRLGQDGQPEFLHHLMSPRTPFAPDNDMLRFARSQALVHLNWLDNPQACLAGLATSPRPLISLDYGEGSYAELAERTLSSVDLAFFSLPEDRAGEAPELARHYRAQGPRLVVFTLAGRGSLAFDGQIHLQPAEPAEWVDPLGAGDAFIGTFLSA